MFSDALDKRGGMVKAETTTQHPEVVDGLGLAVDVVLEALQAIGAASLGFENQDRDPAMASRFLVLLFASDAALTAHQEMRSLVQGFYSEAGTLHRLLAEEVCKCAFYATFPDDALSACVSAFRKELSPHEMAKRTKLNAFGRAFGMLSEFSHAATARRMKLAMRGETGGRVSFDPWPRYQRDFFEPLATDMIRQLVILAMHLEKTFSDVLHRPHPWQARLLQLQRTADAVLGMATDDEAPSTA